MRLFYNKSFLAILIVVLLVGMVMVCDGAEIKGSEPGAVFLHGTVQGLDGALILELNHAEDLKITSEAPFQFTTPLVAKQGYEVKIKKPALNHLCEIENGQGVIGQEIQADMKINCQKTGEWLHPQTLDDRLSLAGKNATSPVVAMDDHGNALVAWIQADGQHQRLYKSEYRENKWHKPSSSMEAISPVGSDAKQPHVAMAANGDMVIVWEQKVGNKNYLMMADKRAGVWRIPGSTVEHISLGETYAWQADVAMDIQGNTIIVWDQTAPSGLQAVFKSEYRNGVWRHPSSEKDFISPLIVPGGDAISARVALNNQGEAVIVWQQAKDNRERIFKSEYRKGTWVHPRDGNDYISPIDKGVGGSAYRPIPSLSDAGRALIVWEQDHEHTKRIYLSEYNQGAWKHPMSMTEAISPVGIKAEVNSVAMDSKGNARIVWATKVERRQYLFVSELRDGKWKHPGQKDFLVGPGSEWQFLVHGVVVQLESGKALLARMQSGDDNISRLWLTEYDNGLWYQPGVNISVEKKPVFDMVAAASKDGSLLVVWVQSDGAVGQIYKSQFYLLKTKNN